MLRLPGEVAVFMHGLFPFLPEGSTKSITQQVSIAPHGDGYGDILEEVSAHVNSLSFTEVLKWVFYRLGRTLRRFMSCNRLHFLKDQAKENRIKSPSLIRLI